MRKYILLAWSVIAVCLLFYCCIEDSSLQLIRMNADDSIDRAQFSDSLHDSKKSNSTESNVLDAQSRNAQQTKPASPGAKADLTSDDPGQLSVEIDTWYLGKTGAIDFDKPFPVSLVNSSRHPIRIWNWYIKKGYYQLSFRFTNKKSGEVRIARKRSIEDRKFWTLLRDEAWSFYDTEPSEIIEIRSKSNREYQTVLFSDFKWGDHVWKGLPKFEDGQEWSIQAQFESSITAPTIDQPIWKGKTRSQDNPAKLIVSGYKSPHVYISSGFPGRALQMMRADPKLIARNDKYGDTPLQRAASIGNYQVVKWLLDNGADVDASALDNYGDLTLTALHQSTHPKVVELILTKKPDLNIRCEYEGYTALQASAANLADPYDAGEKRKWQRIVQMYLDAGAKYDVLTAIHLDDLERVKTILSQSPKLADDFQGRSLLRIAAVSGRLEICRYLIKQHRVDVVDFERLAGYPIIKGALKHPKVIDSLIKNGVDLKTRITWRGGRTGIWIIGDDATALHFAAKEGVPETIKLLIDNGVDIFATAHEFGDKKNNKQTALEVAGNFENAMAILNHPKFDEANQPQRQASLNRSFSSVAFYSGSNMKLIDALLRKGADPNTQKKGATAFQTAAWAIDPELEAANQKIKKLITLLVKHGAKLDLYSAVAIGDHAQVAQLLKQNPKSANLRRVDGYPALHCAVAMNYEGIVKNLLAAGADVDIRNNSEKTDYEDQTSLHCAAKWGRYEIAKLLIAAGADVNAVTQIKSTPLHHAARISNVKTVRLLLENGAKIDVRDKQGETPLDWCRELNRTDADKIEELFREDQQRK